MAFPEYTIGDNFGTLAVAESEPPEFTKREKVYVAGVDVHILSERRQFLDADGRLIITSLKEYTKNGIVRSYRTARHLLVGVERGGKETGGHRRTGDGDLPRGVTLENMI